jgi:hypothetical protein
MDELDRDTLTEALSALGQVLQVRGLSYQVVLVGGANLMLRGIVSRPTKDADLLGTRSPTGLIVRLDELPAPLTEAIRDVALTYALSEEWLNLGPRSLLDRPLPDGFENRLEAADFGALRVWFAGTFDLVCFKLWAAADHWPSMTVTSTTCWPSDRLATSYSMPLGGQGVATLRPATVHCSWPCSSVWVSRMPRRH